MPLLAMPTPKRVASHRSGLLIRNFCARIASAEALIHQARRAMARQRYLQIVCAWCQQTIRWAAVRGGGAGGQSSHHYLLCLFCGRVWGASPSPPIPVRSSQLP